MNNKSNYQYLLSDLTDLEKLLDVDDNTLYDFYNGIPSKVELKDNYINSLFKNFKYNDLE